MRNFYFIVSLFISHFVLAQQKPFPQAKEAVNVIRPSKTQAALNQDVLTYYQTWKDKYLKHDLKCLPNGYYVVGQVTGLVDDYTPLGSSEGIGYGMLITAFMNDKVAFDGLYNTARYFESKENKNLMGWIVADDANAAKHFNSATDGDLDIAYALLLAHQQWDTGNSKYYFTEAINRIQHGIKIANITPQHLTNLGDWQSSHTNDSRPSDWMLTHFQAFYKYTNDSLWLKVHDACLNNIQNIQNTYSPTTGLLPDFVTNNPISPAQPLFLEGLNDGNYYYNACRTPLRIAMDWGLYKNEAAKLASDKMVNWAIQQHAKASNIKAGYTLKGEDLEDNAYESNIFIAPMVAAACNNAKNQLFVDEGWNYMTAQQQGYFEDTYTLLCLFYISGNWWVP